MFPAISRLQTFTAMKIHVVIWVMTPCSDMARYHIFGGPCCFQDAERPRYLWLSSG